MATRNAEQVKTESKVAENGNSPNPVNQKSHGHQGGGGNNPQNQNNQFRKNDKFGGPGNMGNRGGGGPMVNIILLMKIFNSDVGFGIVDLCKYYKLRL